MHLLIMTELFWLKNLTEISDNDCRGSFFLFKKISVLIERYNAIMLHESFIEANRPDQ